MHQHSQAETGRNDALEQPEVQQHSKECFKKLPVEFRNRLSELDGYELKVWLCYLLHGNVESVAWPSRETIHLETGLSPDWISKARTKLKKNQWLVEEVTHRKSGRFGAPRLIAVVPDHDNVTASRCDTDAAKERDEVNQAHRADVNQAHRADVTSARSRSKEVDATEVDSVAAAWDFAFSSYDEKFSEVPNWAERDRAELKALFDRKSDLTLVEFQRRWGFYLQSTDPFYVRQGHSLKFFCVHAFDAVRDGPRNDERGREDDSKPYGGMSRKEMERRRSEVSPEGRRLYEQIGVRPN